MVDTTDHAGQDYTMLPVPAGNRALAELYFARFPHDLALPREAFSEGFVFHHMREVIGCEAFEEFMCGVSRAFPNFHFDVHHLIEQGDFVAAHYTFSGTQQETFLGVVPSRGESFAARGMSLFRCAGGRIEEIWVAFNTLAMMQQLGAVAPLGDGV